MAQASAARSVQPRAAEARDLLFKPDHPREIDRYIDFFGGTIDTAAHDEPDTCGEVLLEWPA